jgi:serine/threonine protein kinase
MDSESPLSAGTRLGAYVLVAPLGAGGMGEVYRAHDSRLDRDVALKLLPASLAADPDRAARFEREARALASLNHPNIVTIHSVEEAEGVRFLTMEVVEGETLDRRIPPQGVPLETLLAVAVPLADAVAAAHERGVVHRDLKPANIMLGPGGRLKVLDFGLARRTPDGTPGEPTGPSSTATTAGVILGTAPYMAPEQVVGEPADSRSDIFALGVVLYEMVSGKNPFRGRTAAETFAAILGTHPTPLTDVRPEIPPELWKIVRRCLEKEAGRRFQSALDVRNELDELQRDVSGSGSTLPARRPAAHRSVGGLVVLPLRNLSGDAAEDYLVDGMTEALITDLAKLGRLKVISRSSAMRFKGTTKSLEEIARELRVDAVVEGSVLRAGDRVRISAQLIRADTDEHLWAERYDRKLEDVLALQDEVARAIVTEVYAALRPGESPRRGDSDRVLPRKVDPEVYLLNLKARQHLLSRTGEGFRAARRLFEEAIALDPGYAPLYVGVAESAGFLANYGIVPPRDVVPTALDAIAKALAIDPKLAEAHRILGFMRWQFEFDWTGAIREYEIALELDPGSADTFYWFGAFLAVIGHFDRAIPLLRRAHELDPLSLIVPAVQGWTCYFARRYEEALPFYHRVLRIDPDFVPARWFLGETLVELGRHDEGIEALERALQLSGGLSRLLGYLGYAYGRAGRTEAAHRALAELREREKEAYVPPYFPALVHAGLEEAGPALDDLERAHAIGDTMLRDLKVDPAWDRLRGEPRFVALMERMAYPDVTE